jgi:hypothetical protein
VSRQAAVEAQGVVKTFEDGRIVRMLDGRAVGEERPAQEIHTTAGGER